LFDANDDFHAVNSPIRKKINARFQPLAKPRHQAKVKLSVHGITNAKKKQDAGQEKSL
jgi:hypothetical protein